MTKILEVISETKNFILVKKFAEGLEVYHCNHCHKTISKPKNKLLKDFHCLYCGQRA